MDRRRELDILNSKKYSFNEKKLLFVGIVNNTIYDKATFPNNKLLNKYVLLFENILSLDEPYKEYLYNSRTLLASRVVRDILKNENDKDLLSLISSHILFIKEKNAKNENNKIVKSKINKTLLDDMISRDY